MVGFARRDVIGLVLALGAVAACVRLGVWQLARLHQRRAANALVRAARERPPRVGAVTRRLPHR